MASMIRALAPPLMHALLIGVLLVRAMVAPGFMPGALSAGPLQLCPNGLPAHAAALLFAADDPAHAGHHADHAHAHHAGHGDAPPPEAPAPLDSSHYEQCSIGEALSQVALTAEAFVALAVLRPLPPDARSHSRFAGRAEIVPRARGPPRPSQVA